MQVTAKVTIQNSTYEVWYNFFLSYAEKRAEFVQNEIVEKLSENEAKVSFEITNLEGLTDLSASREIIEKEAEMGVTTEIL
jgi:16S rRNA U1498 N3-methylase RsmE|tara:strand:+ start:278 stop:520 length:243 start_codon:yes stop_codon:yes gene_type:complete